MPVRVKIRGIHATALSALVQQTPGYEVTSPSREIAARLQLPVSFKPADVVVLDRNDLSGIIVEANASHLDDPASPFTHDGIPGCAISRGHPNKHAIFVGKVVKTIDKFRVNHVLIENEGRKVVAILPDSTLREKTSVIVQVTDPGSYSGKRKPVVSRRISCPGQYAVLVPDRGVLRHSRNITDAGLRAELADIAGSVDGLRDIAGIVFRSACNDAFMPDVQRELEALASKIDAITSAIDATDSRAECGLIIDPFDVGQVNVLFSKDSLDCLDAARSKHVSTIPNHHYWRAFTQIAGDQHLVSFTEQSTGDHPDTRVMLVRAFTRYARSNLGFPRPGDVMSILHFKPNGDMFKLKQGTVIDTFQSNGNVLDPGEECSTLVLKRQFDPHPWHKSFYDGFDGLDIQPGDYSTCHAKEHFPVLTNKYFRKDHTFLGCYYNISTPVLIFPGEIRYVDLEIDVVEYEGGERRIIDKEKLDKAVAAGHVSGAHGAAARALAERIAAGGLKDDLSCDETFF